MVVETRTVGKRPENPPAVELKPSQIFFLPESGSDVLSEYGIAIQRILNLGDIVRTHSPAGDSGITAERYKEVESDLERACGEKGIDKGQLKNLGSQFRDLVHARKLSIRDKYPIRTRTEEKIVT